MKKLKPAQYLKQRGLKDADNHGDFDNISPNQAREILHAKKVNGKPLTDEQRRLFGFLSKGNTKKYQDGGLLPNVNVYTTKDKTTRNFLNQLGNKPPQENDLNNDTELDNAFYDDDYELIPERYENVWKSWKDNGKPSIRYIPKSFEDKLDIDMTDQKRFEKYRANYNDYRNTINLSPNYSGDNPEHLYLAELAHSAQKKKGSLTGNWIGEKGYKTYGNVEHEAHSIIEPQLKKKYFSVPEELTEEEKKNRKLKKGGTISEMGYRDDSPFRNRESIDINTPTGLIDMSNTGIPLMANGIPLEPYSGLHQMGTTKVKEVPMKKGGKIKKYQLGKSGTYDDYLKQMWGTSQPAPVNPNALQPIANPNYVPKQTPTATEQVQTIDTSLMRSPLTKNQGKSKSAPNFSIGAGLAFGIGAINSLLGSEQPRKKVLDPLTYNPYPQGTGSQAIFQSGGTPRKVTEVPEGYKPYTMQDGIPGASYFMKETQGAQKAMSTTNRTRSSVPRSSGVRKAMPLKRAAASSGNSSLSQDFIYTEPNPAPTPVAQDKPQKAWIGDNFYTGNRLSHTSQLQYRDSKGVRDNGVMDAREQVDVVHPYYPNSSKVNFDETYEVPHPTWTNYFTGGLNHIQGSLDSLKTYKVPNKLKNGGKMKKCADGGLMTFSGGSAPQVSENPFDGGMGEFQGNSHEDNGIKSSFNGTEFEAEGGEPYRIDKTGNLEIFGDLTNPVTGNKFKKDAKSLARKEKKVAKFTNNGLDLVLGAEPSASKWDLLQFNSGKAMLKGGLDKQKELAETKEHLSLLQRVALAADNPQKNYRNGGLVFQSGGKPWEYRKTKKDKIDKKILDFVELASQKGLTGYSGEKSGYDVRNTKSGHPSRHGTNQALDAIFDDKDAYNKILADPELSKYLYDNGLTMINEFDPAIALQTGATEGHLHIGYDKGTPVSDKFRMDYKTKYKPSTPPPAVASSRFTPFDGGNKGDAYTEVPTINPTTGNEYTFNRKVGNKAPVTDPAPYPSPRQFEFHTPTNKVEKMDTRVPWEQIVPAIPQVFDQPDHVDGQTYQPELYTPYQVTFQDRINQNSRTFNALTPTLGRNPEAQSVLAGEQYAANNAVQAEEFRTNQAISNDITNKNVSLLNESKLRNIQLRDTQSVRQAQAVANTRDRRTQAGIQIGDILAKNSLENKTAAVYKNLYKDYKFDKDMNLQYVGPEASEHIDPTSAGANYPVQSTVTKKVGDTTTKDVYEPYNYKPISLMDGYEKRARGRMTLGRIANKLYGQ